MEAIGFFDTVKNDVTDSGKKLVSIILPSGTTTIGNSAFWGCTSLTSVTSIRLIAFENCTSLTSIIIPNSITAIGFSAFGGCTNLTSVKFEGTIAEDKLGSDEKSPFMGDLKEKYLTGGIGTYTTTAPVSNTSVWTKTP